MSYVRLAALLLLTIIVVGCGAESGETRENNERGPAAAPDDSAPPQPEPEPRVPDGAGGSQSAVLPTSDPAQPDGEPPAETVGSFTTRVGDDLCPMPCTDGLVCVEFKDGRDEPFCSWDPAGPFPSSF